MREIKFRGKHPKIGKWFYGWVTRFPNGYEYQIIDYGAGSGGSSHDVIPETVGQYTGLKDHKGREIFEGDVLECLAIDDGPFVVRVVFRNGAFHTDVHDGVNGADFTCLLVDLFALGEVRIVGNIWDGYSQFVSIEGIGGFEK